MMQPGCKRGKGGMIVLAMLLEVLCHAVTVIAHQDASRGCRNVKA